MQCIVQHTYGTYLQKVGIRETLPRKRILELLHEKGPLSADTIISLDKKIDRVTAYRTLGLFLEKGLVRKVIHGSSAARFELTDHHSHYLTCVRCGTSETVSYCIPSSLEQRVLRESSQFARIQSHALEFVGLCKTCAK
jgi:Fe2+ or Zn2+ uptake regulation protein